MAFRLSVIVTFDSQLTWLSPVAVDGQPEAAIRLLVQIAMPRVIDQQVVLIREGFPIVVERADDIGPGRIQQQVYLVTI